MKIKEMRARAGITQAELAVKLGMDRTTITKWETGKSMPRAATLLKLAETLGCSVGELIA